MRTVDDIPLLAIAANDRDHRAELNRDALGVARRIGVEQDDLCALKLVKRVLFVNSPELMHELLVEKARQFEKSPVIRGVLRPLAGEGLFSATNDHWRPHRKLMAPLFQPGALARYAADMADCALRGIAAWRDGDEIPMARETTRITMDIAGRTLFHAETSDAADEIGAAITTALTWADAQSTSLAYMLQILTSNALKNAAARTPALEGPLRRAGEWMEIPLSFRLPLPDRQSRAVHEAVRIVDARMQRLIEERRADAAAGKPRKPDLLTTLLEARYDDGTPLPDKQLRDEVITLFVAGHETTASALAWSLAFLAKDPALYARVRAEVDALSGRVPGMADLPSLSLTLRVFKEALRYYPPVFFLARQCVTDGVEIGGCKVPRGAVVIFSPYALHHRASLWPDPERFDPDRFLPEAEAARPRNAYIPFGAGPRSCIGNHFALIEGPIVLALILQKADLTLIGEPEPEPLATLRPKNLKMRVKLRNPAEAAATA